MLKLMGSLLALVLLAVVTAAVPARVALCHGEGFSAAAAAEAAQPASHHHTAGVPAHQPNRPTPCGKLGSCGLCGAQAAEDPPMVAARVLRVAAVAISERDPGAMAAPPPTPPPRG